VDEADQKLGMGSGEGKEDRKRRIKRGNRRKG